MTMRYGEAVAKRVLEMAIPGACMVFRENQSNMEYDFDLRLANGKLAAVEATTSTNQAYRRTIDRIYGRKNGGSCIDAVECKNSWIVFTPSNEIGKIRKAVDGYLARLEAEGIESFSCIDRAQCVQDLCADLKLTSGRAIPSMVAPPEIHIQFSPPASAVCATDPIKSSEKEMEANKKKLGNAQKNERHLVAYVDQVHGQPFAALTSFEPPTEFPRLPNEIAHIWPITEVGKDHFVVWRGSKTEKWHTVDLPKVPQESSTGEK